jgi:membrane-associated phospholipid phosphatase
MKAPPKVREAASPVEKTDIAVAETFGPVRDNPAVKSMGVASELGDQPPLYALAGGVIVAGLALNDARTLRAGSRMLAAHVVAITLKNLLKRCIDRTRPNMISDSGQYEMGRGRRFEHRFNSFPSGHTASSVAVARGLGREYPGQHGAALGIASTIAVTQVVRSTHFISDILAGAAVGLGAEALVHLGFKRFHPDVA